MCSKPHRCDIVWRYTGRQSIRKTSVILNSGSIAPPCERRLNGRERTAIKKYAHHAPILQDDAVIDRQSYCELQICWVNDLHGSFPDRNGSTNQVTNAFKDQETRLWGTDINSRQTILGKRQFRLRKRELGLGDLYLACCRAIRKGRVLQLFQPSSCDNYLSVRNLKRIAQLCVIVF